jgi:hypothetical protein
MCTAVAFDRTGISLGMKKYLAVCSRQTTTVMKPSCCAFSRATRRQAELSVRVC